MAEGGGASSSDNLIYSIQQTYILTPRMHAEKFIITCDQRIDIPTIEPLVNRSYESVESVTVIPCIELSGAFMSEVNLTFETNEGVTVLPVEIKQRNNPYVSFRYVLVLPRGTTGVKSCKIIHKTTGVELQHNFTFGIMPPPYNYDNASFDYLFNKVVDNSSLISGLGDKVNLLKLTTKTPTFTSIELPKGAGKQTINTEDGVLFYYALFTYPLSSEPSIHKPKITLYGDGHDLIYTLSLNKDINVVSIDLFTGMIRACDVNGEIAQQFMLGITNQGYETISFENFDDIDTSALFVIPRGARVE